MSMFSLRSSVEDARDRINGLAQGLREKSELPPAEAQRAILQLAENTAAVGNALAQLLSELEDMGRGRSGYPLT